MLKWRAAYVVILSLLVIGTSNAEDGSFSIMGIDKGFSVKGISRLSCGKYIQDIATSPEAANVYSWWVAGFITGANLQKGRTNSTDDAAHEAWLKKYCQENPLDYFIEAAIKLNKVLDR